MKMRRLKEEGGRTEFRPRAPYLLLGSTVCLLASALAAHADDSAASAPPASPGDAVAAHQGYEPSRYEELWTKSPFAVETPDQAVTESAEYTLVGIAELGGVTYASLIEKQNSDHILVSSDKPLDGLSLNSVSKKEDGTYATLTHNGELITLKLESGSGGLQPGANPALGQQMPNFPASYQQNGQNYPMPGNFNPATARPFIRVHRPIIHVPPRQFSNQAPGQPDAPQPAP